jgi:hypothetical protein
MKWKVSILLIIIVLCSASFVSAAYSASRTLVGAGGSSTGDYDNSVVIDIAGKSSGDYTNYLGFYAAASYVDALEVLYEITFINSTTSHEFNATAGVYASRPIVSITPTIDSGSCTSVLNVSSDGFTNTTFTCSGTPYSLANISIEFCSSTKCVNAATASNAYPNQAPSIGAVVITPEHPESSDDLTCTVSGYSDAESDPAQYYYTWFRNDTFYSNTLQSGTSHVMGSGNTAAYDTWTCQVTPYDGYINGTAINATKSITACNPPGSGDWDITDTQSCHDRHIIIHNILDVQSGGTLILDNVTLNFTAAGQTYTWYVRSGGTLRTDNGTIFRNTAGQNDYARFYGDVILKNTTNPGTGTERFYTRFETTATARIEDSDLNFISIMYAASDVEIINSYFNILQYYTSGQTVEFDGFLEDEADFTKNFTNAAGYINISDSLFNQLRIYNNGGTLTVNNSDLTYLAHYNYANDHTTVQNTVSGSLLYYAYQGGRYVDIQDYWTPITSLTETLSTSDNDLIMDNFTFSSLWFYSNNADFTINNSRLFWFQVFSGSQGNFSNSLLTYRHYLYNTAQVTYQNVTLSASTDSRFYDTSVANFTQPYSTIDDLLLVGGAENPTWYGYVNITSPIDNWNSGSVLNRYFPFNVTDQNGNPKENVNVSIFQGASFINEGLTGSDGIAQINISADDSATNGQTEYEIYADDVYSQNITMLTSTAPYGIQVTSQLEVEHNITFSNYSTLHNFNVTAGAWSTSGLTSSSITTDSGSCLYDSNVTNGFYTNVTYNCSGYPYSLANVSIEFCVSAGCVDTPTASNAYPNRKSQVSGFVINTSVNFNYTTQDILAYPQSVDNDSDVIYETIDWIVNGTSVAVLNMPFNVDVSSTDSGAVRDYSGYGNNATLGAGSLSPTWNSSCMVGGCYDFDGATEYVSLPDVSTAIDRELTICSWFNTRQVTDQHIVQMDRYSFHALWLNTDLDVVFEHAWNTGGNEVQLYSTHPVNVGEWYHACGVLEVVDDTYSDMFLYVNGQLNSSSLGVNGTYLKYVTSSAYIGRERRADYQDYFNGSIDEVMIFNRSLSSEQVTEIYNAGLSGTGVYNLSANETSVGDMWSATVFATDSYEEGENLTSGSITIRDIPTVDNVSLNATSVENTTYDNLTLFYDLNGSASVASADWRVNSNSWTLLNLPFNVRKDTPSTGAIRDYSSLGNNATLGGGVADESPAWNTTCVVGGCYDFDGADDFIQLSSSIDFSSPTTISMWVYPRNLTPTGAIRQLISDEVGSDRLMVSSSGGLQIRQGGTNYALSSAGEIPLNAWSHVVMRWNGSQVVGFVDGTEGSSQDFGSLTSYERIARYSSASNGIWDGFIDEVLVLNRSLSSSQITELFNAGLAGISLANITSDETSTGDVWQGCVTPTDSLSDGATVCSNSLSLDDSLELDFGNVFVNYTDAHSFNVTAGVIVSTILSNTSVTIDSGSCSYLTNESSGNTINVTYNCSGIPYVLANVSMEFCISTKCVSTVTSVNAYPNQAPSIPTLLTPANNTLTVHDLTPLFNWTDSVDPEGDAINYTWDIDTNAFCNLPLATTVHESNFTPSTDLCPDALEYYYWNVTACDAWDCATTTDNFQFILEPYVEIVFVTDTVDFGVLNISQTDNTSDDDPTPFHLRNEGNVASELVNMSADSSLWSSPSGGFGSTYWQSKAREVTGEENSFNASTQTTYTPVLSSLTGFIAGLNYTDSNDEVYIDFLVTVPDDESPGAKSSTVTFSWGVNP